MITKFELTKKQEEGIKEWQEAIKKTFGEYGSFDFIFSPNEIGMGLVVYSNLAKVEKDFTDFDSW
jgi:adenosyl cobinamide kinase/adenosyl cobinamide phosphate guanylyltransferase